MNYKIAIHITSYVDKNYLERFNFLKKIVGNYKFISKNSDIFIHVNTIVKKEYRVKNVKYIYHNLFGEDPHQLSWKCRILMYKQKKNYDFFIYSEDDILFTKKNFNYWLKFKELCIKNNFNLGFIRTELDNNNEIYCSDLTENISNFIYLNKKKFVVLSSPYCAFWIYDSKEFNKFTETNIWNFKWENKTAFQYYYIREMSAIGWNGVNMTRYKATIMPLLKNKILKSSLIKHMTNRYALSPMGKYGTLKLNSVVSKRLIKFRPITKFRRFLINFYFFLTRLVKL